MPTDTAMSAAVRMPPAFARTALPGRIVFGDGALGRLGDELDQRDLRGAMLIAADYDARLGQRGRAALGERVRLSWGEVRQHVLRGKVHDEESESQDVPKIEASDWPRSSRQIIPARA